VWGQKELAALRLGVIKHGAGNWEHIRSDPELSETLATRSGEQIKDKWRNLVKFNHVTPEELAASKLKARKRANVKRAKTFSSGTSSSGSQPPRGLAQVPEAGASMSPRPPHPADMSGPSVGTTVAVVSKTRRPVRQSRTAPDMRAMVNGPSTHSNGIVKRQSSVRNLVLANPGASHASFPSNPRGGNLLETLEAPRSGSAHQSTTDLCNGSPQASHGTANSSNNDHATKPAIQDWKKDLDELDIILGLMDSPTCAQSDNRGAAQPAQVHHPEPPQGVPAAALNNVGWPSVFVDRRLYTDSASSGHRQSQFPGSSFMNPPVISGAKDLQSFSSHRPAGPPGMPDQFGQQQIPFMGHQQVGYSGVPCQVPNMGADPSAHSSVAGDLHSTEMELTLHESLARLSFDGLADALYSAFDNEDEPSPSLLDLMEAPSGLPPGITGPLGSQLSLQHGFGVSGGMEHQSFYPNGMAYGYQGAGQ